MMTEIQIANINGVITNAKDAKISIFDRGFLYGDSLYEVVRTYNQKAVLVKEHLDRLRESARMSYFDLTQDHYLQFELEIQRTITEFYDRHHAAKNKTKPELYVRLIVTRGQGRIGFSRKAIESGPNIVIMCEAIPERKSEAYQKGLKLKMGNDRIRLSPRSLSPAIKSGNYLNCVLAYLEAEPEYDDAILLDQDGFVTEGTTFNVFYIKNGTCVTSPSDGGILDGITRKYVLQLAKDLGLKTRIARFKADSLYNAEEVFITGTIREVCPVSQVNDQIITLSGPLDAKSRQSQVKRTCGPFTKKLLQHYTDFTARLTNSENERETAPSEFSKKNPGKSKK